MSNNNDKKGDGQYHSVMEDFDQPAEGWITRMVKKNPMYPVGIVAGVGVLGYSAYQFKNKQTKLSVYLIQTRVAMQSAVIGCVTLGVIYTVFKDNFFPKKE